MKTIIDEAYGQNFEATGSFLTSTSRTIGLHLIGQICRRAACERMTDVNYAIITV